MKDKTCCFTGHRKLDEKEIPRIQKNLESEIKNLICQGVCYFGAGGALGFDTLAALTVLKLKLDFSHIRLILILPCKEQTKGWSKSDKRIYNYILKKSDKVVYTSEEYHQGCMHKRNRHLLIIAVFVSVTAPKQAEALRIQSITLLKKDFGLLISRRFHRNPATVLPL